MNTTRRTDDAIAIDQGVTAYLNGCNNKPDARAAVAYLAGWMKGNPPLAAAFDRLIAAIEVTEMSVGAKRYAYQDGCDFYDQLTGEVIATYPGMVRNDNDTAGAAEARARFERKHPEYDI